jgi:kinesin family protein 1
MEEMKKTYESRLAEALALAKSRENEQSTINEKAKICPHLSNINLDPMLTGSLKHLIEFGPNKKKLVVGSVDKVDIHMSGLGIQDRHCGISFEGDNFFLEPFPNARVMKNGKQYTEKFQLNNFDRLVFGASLYFLFVNPYKCEQDSNTVSSLATTFTVEKVQQEIAEESGLISNSMDHKTPDELACLNELIDLM